MSKQKQFTRPPKKAKAKIANPETVDDYQELADVEEDAGGKWRKGDPAKSGRAFVRALDVYERGLQSHPGSFDLAYNKARLQLELTQQPALVAHIGLPLVDLLQQTLASHRYALSIDDGNADILFNTSQVLTALAEHLADARRSADAIKLLHEALELLSVCLSRQEMLLEQQSIDFDDAEDGCVPLDPDEKPASSSSSATSEQTATVVEPLTPSDLLDTVHASLTALTTLVGLADATALQTLGNLAHSLTESKGPSYVEQLPPLSQEEARFEVLMSRAVFVAAYADAQYNAMMIDLDTYLDRMDTSFELPNKQRSSTALCSEGEARTELATSIMTRFDNAADLPASTCWKQLTLAQDLYTQAAKLFGNSSQTYVSRGDVEMLRHRLARMSNAQVSDSQRRSAPTLIQNAQTYYQNAVKLADSDEEDLKLRARQRRWIAVRVRYLLYEDESAKGAMETIDAAEGLPANIMTALEECVEDRMIESSLAREIGRMFIKS